VNTKVVVIGAGIAGLTAAHDLRKAGCDVTILEKAAHPGGRMADLNMNGLNVHSGATIIWSFYHDMMDLIREFDLEGELESYQSEYTLDNGTHQFPLSVTPAPAQLLMNPAISVTSKARLATLLPDMIMSGLKTDPNLLHTAIEYDDGESIADYITRKVGRDFLENYVAPLFRIPWSWNVEDISKAYLLSIFGHLTTAKTLTFRQGIGSLTRAVAASLPVSYGADVGRIEETASGVTIHYSQEGESRTLVADFAVCATEGNRVRELVPQRTDDAFFASVRYNKCAAVYYTLKTKPPVLSRWFSREHPCTIPFYAQIPDDPFTPSGRQKPHLYCELTPETIEEIHRAGHQEAFRHYVEDDARTLYPTLADDLDEVVEQWIEDMLPVIYPGYAKKVAAFLEEMEARPARLYFCGDYLAHAHTGGACASGRFAAKLLQKHHLR